MKFDGKILAVLACLLLVAGVATAEDSATAKATKTEKVTEQTPATEQAETAQAEKAEGAQAEKAEKQETAQAGATAKQPTTKAATAETPKKVKTAEAPEPARKQMKQAEMADGISISEIAICEDVEERVPVHPADSFSSEIGQLWCFTRVQNADAPTQIFHRWYVGDDLVDEIAIEVGGHHWRCWSTKTILPNWTGQCRVEILTEQGDVISTKEFVLEG